MAKSKRKIPIIAEEKHERITDVILSIGAFRWDEQKFVNLETEEVVKGKIWRLCGSASLASIQTRGRKVLEHTIDPKTKKNKTRIVGHVYGYEAIAQALSGRFPCSTEEAKRLIQECRDRRIKHALLVLKSDLVPTSPDKYEGKNEWVVLANYPDSDEMYRRINEALKASGSPLRVKRGLRARLVD